MILDSELLNSSFMAPGGCNRRGAFSWAKTAKQKALTTDGQDLLKVQMLRRFVLG
jgi:hypothetical protein